MEGVGYWLFIAVLYLLSSLMKKRQQKAAREKLDDDYEKPENGPKGKFNVEFLQDIYNEFQGLTEDEFIESEDGSEDEIEEEIEEEWINPVPSPVESREQGVAVFDNVSDHTFDKKNERFKYGIPHPSKTAFGGNLFSSLDALKRAVIFKEILDKPRAMRRTIR